MKAKHPGPTLVWMITTALAVAWALVISAPAHATNPCEDPSGNPHVLGPSPAVTTAALESWIKALPDGTIGCLEAGSYGNGSGVYLNDDRGSNTNRVKIRTRPSDVANGNYATIHARLTFGPDAGFYTYRFLYVDSSGQSGLGAETINTSPGAVSIYIADANITNGGEDTAACVSPSGPNFILQRSIIHDCGDPTAGSDANLDQCVYVSGPGGPPWGNYRGAVITHNLIYKCAATGVTVYPNGDEAKVTYNVIDRSGFGVQTGGDLVGNTCQASYFVDANNNTNTNMTGVHNSGYDNATAAASEYWGCSGYGIFDYYNNNCHYNNAHAEYDFTHVSAGGNIEVTSDPYTNWPHVNSGSGCYAKTGDPVSEITIPLPTRP